MIKTNTENKEAQQQRLQSRTQDQQLINEVIEGAGMSRWEAQVVVESVGEIYFSEPGNKVLRSGQIRYNCTRIDQGAGKAIKDCQLVSCALTLIEGEDHKFVGSSEELRRHKLIRMSEEAREQEGLLTQEDLAALLCCDVRTIRRDIKHLKESIGFMVPTRGQQKDIGPTLTHKGIAIRHWLEGKEPQEVARTINHSLHAVERYIGHFARVVFLAGSGFESLQIAFTVGISTPTVRTYLELYHHHKDHPGFRTRLSELKAIGESHFQSADQKKGALLQPVASSNSKQN
jgi:DNA-binding CsgD family transcriptional regulator